MRHLIILTAAVLLVVPLTAQTAGEFVQVDEATWAWIAGDVRTPAGALFIGTEEALAVDPGATVEEVRAFLDAAARLTRVPVRHVVATGAEPGRALGAGLVPQRSFSFLSRHETRARLARHRVAGAAVSGAAHPLDAYRLALPDRPFGADLRVDLGGRTVLVLALAEAREGTAAAVWDPDRRILATGGLFSSGVFPDLRGEHVERWFTDLDRLTALDARVVLPGYGPTATGDDLVRFVDYLRELADLAHAAHHDGTSIDALVAEAEAAVPDLVDGPVEAMSLRGNLEALLEHAGEHERTPRRLPKDYPIEAIAPADPPAAVTTADGRLRFTPTADGTVNVFDAFNGIEVADIPVGRHLGRGCLLRHDTDFVVPVRDGHAHLAVINTATFGVVDRVEIEGDPWTATLSPAGDVIHVAEADLPLVHVVDVATWETTALLEYDPGAPGEAAAAPGRDDAGEAPRAAGGVVTVFGMTHSRHRTSETWGLEQVREAVRRFAPDVVLTEIPPNRWRRIEEDWTARGVIEDERVKLFPEYVDVLLPLAVEDGFEIVPCAAWNAEMATQRRRRTKELESAENADLAARARRAESEASTDAVRALLRSDDPLVIHSDAYDAAVKARMSGSVLLNDHVGAGGWTNVNAAHYALISDALAAHRGKRVLITFGAWHKYWFLERLAERQDFEVVDPRPFLAGSPSDRRDLARNCVDEVVSLHRFFERWFRGEIEEDDPEFDRVERALAPGFRLVDPRARVNSRAESLRRIRAGRGKRDEASSITITGAAARSIGDGSWLVTYEERIEDRGVKTAIRSTAIMRADSTAPNGVHWVDLHETAIASD